MAVATASPPPWQQPLPPADTTNTEHHHLVTAPPRQNHHHRSHRAPPPWLLPSYKQPTPTAATTTATAAAFPTAVVAVAGCGWQISHHRRGGAYTNPDLFLAFPCMGLSAAKPPPWWRSDDGTATTAAPYGVGLVVAYDNANDRSIGFDNPVRGMGIFISGDYASACLDGKPFGTFVNSDFIISNVTFCKTSLLRSFSMTCAYGL
nr:hypothetical protein [Tanacetum cinerariifolium]